MSRLSSSSVLCVALLLVGCRGPVPDDHTSLGLDPGQDPGKPPRKLTMVWLHHSTGDRLLAGGLLAALVANNIGFYDINYEEAVVDGYVVGDHTDPPDFPKLFNTPRYLDVVRGWELKGDRKQHDVIMFKSCYPASDIESDRMLDQYKEYYAAMLPVFRANPGILFIPMSTPPRTTRRTTPQIAARARHFARWLSSVYAKDVRNVQVFDLFNALAIVEGKPNANTLAPQFAESATDSHPTPAGGRAVARMFIPWFNRAIREAGLVQ
jgi:hypothetical protein